MRDPYIKRRAQQIRYRAARSMILEAGFWCLLLWLIWKGICAATAESRTLPPVVVKASRHALPGLYGCPQVAPRG